jgi:tetratricopeptide (TPR) repeat protein
MAAIYRSRGHLLGSAMILEFCVLLNGWLKNGQSQAIARSQLASTYRYLNMYLQAANVAQHAIAYFRRSDDRLNLGRTLLTQGNIHENLGRIERAMACFDEALRIGQQIADPQATVGAMSGKARALMRLDHLDEAKALLDEAISLRKRRGDHAVGFEYQNLGLLYEKKDNLAVALSWHKKALKEFEQYMPLEVERCSNRIAVLEKKLEKRLEKKRK